MAVGGARLDGVGDDAVVDQVDRDDVGRPGELGVGGRRVAQVPVEADVAGGLVPHQGRAVGDGVVQVRDGRQRVVVDLDELGRVLGLRLGLGDDHDDRIADVPHLALRQGRVRRLDHDRAVLVLDLPAAGDAAQPVGGHVVAGQDGEHARRRERAAEASIDRIAAWAYGRADEHGPGLPRQHDVVGVAPLAEEEAAVLLAGDGSAHALAGRSLGTSPHRLRRRQHGLDDVVVAGAAAEVPLQPVPDVGLGRLGIALHQLGGAHHHAGRAEAALQAVAGR